MKSKVAVIKTSPTAVLADIEKISLMAGLAEALPKDKPVILKDNISWHLPFPSANTTPWQLEGIIKTLRTAGYGNISAVHNNTVVTKPSQGLILNRLGPIYKKYQIPELYNFNPADIKWILYQPKSKMPALDKIFPAGIMIPEYFIGKSIIHLPTVKCHIYTTTTGAMKNAFGGLMNTRRHQSHSWIHQTLVDLLAIQKEIHPGIFTLMDGTTCGNGPGPRTMMPVEKDFILAGSDSVAIDAVAARMMGFEPMNIPYIRLATEAGLGTGIMKDIEIIGADISDVNFHFRVGHNFVSRFGHLFWFSPLKIFQKLLFQTPLIAFFILGSNLYHDKIWWTFKGKKLYRQFLNNSKWGKLFKVYTEI